jgi:hypothetical protein
VARLIKSYDELYQHALQMIGRSRNLTKTMMAEGFIAPVPKE